MMPSGRTGDEVLDDLNRWLTFAHSSRVFVPLCPNDFAAPSRSKDLNIQISIEKAFKAEWLHHHIFRKGETAITWHLLPPLYFSFFSND